MIGWNREWACRAVVAVVSPGRAVSVCDADGADDCGAPMEFGVELWSCHHHCPGVCSSVCSGVCSGVCDALEPSLSLHGGLVPRPGV